MQLVPVQAMAPIPLPERAEEDTVLVVVPVDTILELIIVVAMALLDLW
jgi:hypothetical protein